MKNEDEYMDDNLEDKSIEPIDDNFFKLSLDEKLKQILSSNNKNNVEIESVSKEDFKRLKEEKIQKRKEKLILYEKDYLLQSSKIKIGKINNKLTILDKIISEIKRDSESLLYCPKIKAKIQELENIQLQYNRFKKMFIFLDDIDIDKLNNLAEDKFKWIIEMEKR